MPPSPSTDARRWLVRLVLLWLLGDVAPAESRLFLGLPLPFLGEDDGLLAETSAGLFTPVLPLLLTGLLDTETRAEGLIRDFRGVPLGFLRTGDESSPAFRGTTVVKVFSANCLDGEHRER